MNKQSGPGAARNVGTQNTKGDIYFFVNSDVVIHQNSLGCVVSKCVNNPEVGALFGSDDKQSPAINFFSQYKNLFHHFIHQTSYINANTFWAGCGAIRKEVFHTVGGFNAAQYPKPSIEDVELGLRINKQGYKILFVSSLCVGLLIGLGIFFLLEYKLFSHIPLVPFYYYIKLSGVVLFLGVNFVVFYTRILQLLQGKTCKTFTSPVVFYRFWICIYPNDLFLF